MNKPIWDKLRTELDRAGRMAQGAFDEGKTRLDAYRSRQLADKAAQALGYAVYRARKENRELETDIYARLSSTLAAHEAEAERLEGELRNSQDASEGQNQSGSGDSGSGERAGGGSASGRSGASSPDEEVPINPS